MAEAEDPYPWTCTGCGRLNKKTMNKCPKCHAHWSTGVKHEVHPRNSSRKSRGAQWKQWNQQWDSQSRQVQVNRDHNHPQRSASRKRNEQQTGRQQSPRSRKGKGKGGNKQGTKQEEEPTVPKAMQPFGGKVTTPAPDSSSTASTAGLLTPAQVYAQNQEYVNALRKAYPDADNIPEDTKALIERTEKDLAKSITTNIHVSTRALSKAQKALSEAVDARKKHRNSWMEYLHEGIQAWEQSLESYRKQQAVLQESASKARQDISLARQAIEINAKAATDPTVLKSIPTHVKEEPEEVTEEADQEELKLRGKLQNLLKSCAGSLGMTMDSETVEPFAVEISDGEDDPPNAKRPRSKDAVRSSPS